MDDNSLGCGCAALIGVFFLCAAIISTVNPNPQMTQLQRRTNNNNYEHDVQYMQGLLRDRGYEASTADIKWAWEQYSKSMCAGWMDMRDPHSSPVDNILNYLEQKP